MVRNEWFWAWWVEKDNTRDFGSTLLLPSMPGHQSMLRQGEWNCTGWHNIAFLTADTKFIASQTKKINQTCLRTTFKKGQLWWKCGKEEVVLLNYILNSWHVWPNNTVPTRMIKNDSGKCISLTKFWQLELIFAVENWDFSEYWKANIW